MDTLSSAKGDRLFHIVNNAVLGLFLIIVLYPLLYVLSASFSSSSAVISGKVWLWPVDFSLEGYQAVFRHRMVWTGFQNTIIYTALGTIVSLFVTILAAYPLSRSDFKGRRAFTLLFVFTMMFNGGLIPSYLLVRELGMLDTIWAMVVPTALSVWNVMIMMTYFRTSIPKELLESAQMDGCNDFKFLLRIVLPLSGPIIAVITLFYGVDQWNQYFNALIFLKKEKLFPLQLVLRDILIQNQVSQETLGDVQTAAARQGLRELLKYSLIVVSSAPLLAAYPFVQKYFVKGIMIGSIKG
ncbi:carbohydrate ABC transporter permease [Paenibacillus apiarius]|uniref:Carbohydrate ABC transporter permease n=1 Tax=Paenibacillus apiarius TaxID=46240 RepID=A0ABT4DN33_9BACL|nr:carbohydrate ABC transporter permease [Paenibacillus apiarius]MBN3522366.1 carbohydrate ABC transporter permease [Paenibacillus apiarius]MCY9517360.1 carbohydrate ABC transporter permease [Paenibacillus apiarius]MCY9518769.1 carbohydrate ABC transporter permease [Paenibacillus apiarius]MCY9552790.1 carbohydrate ABC transporter permease [Paenibacillus apiarius]MCY9556815.1 carbohydrate ABC transporter permease [Paenibacillus apiarius]